MSNVQKQRVNTINRIKKKEDNYNHFDHSDQNERDRTKPCNLVDDAKKIKTVKKKKDKIPNVIIQNKQEVESEPIIWHMNIYHLGFSICDTKMSCFFNESW